MFLVPAPPRISPWKRNLLRQQNVQTRIRLFFFLPFLLSVPSLHPTDSYHVWWSSESQSKCRLCPKRVNTVNRNDFLTSEQLNHQKNVNFARHLPGIRIKPSGRRRLADRKRRKNPLSRCICFLLFSFYFFFF